MIGKLIELYAAGVRDARGGRKRARLWSETDKHRCFYLLGLKDERRRMRERHRLAQGDLFLGEPDANGS